MFLWITPPPPPRPPRGDWTPPPPKPKPPPETECRSPWPASVALVAMVVLILAYGILDPFEDSQAPADDARRVDTTWDTMTDAYWPGEIIMYVYIQRATIDSSMIYRVTSDDPQAPDFRADLVSAEIWFLNVPSGKPDSSVTFFPNEKGGI